MAMPALPDATADADVYFITVDCGGSGGARERTIGRDTGQRGAGGRTSHHAKRGGDTHTAPGRPVVGSVERVRSPSEVQHFLYYTAPACLILLS